MEYRGVITGSGALTINRGGEAILSGANIFTGPTFINGGYLALVGSTVSIASSSGVFMNGRDSEFDISDASNGATIKTLAGDRFATVDLGRRTLTLSNATSEFGGVIAGSGGLTLNAGTETLSGRNEYTGLTTINGGKLIVTGDVSSSSGVRIGSGGTFQLGAGGSTGAYNGPVTDNGTMVFNRSGSQSFAGAITGTGSVVQAGNGTTILLAPANHPARRDDDRRDEGRRRDDRRDHDRDDRRFSGSSASISASAPFNTYSGQTLVNAGVLKGGLANIFSANSAHVIASGATLDLGNFAQTIGSLAGSGSVALGSANLTTGNDNTSTSFSGVIAGAGSLTKVGSGQFTLTGANLFSGGTALQSGAIGIGNSAALGSGALTISNASTLQFTANNLMFANAVTLQGAAQTIDTQLNASTMSGGISGSGGFRKIGAGSLTLSGSNAYTGETKVDGGSLVVNGSTAASTLTSVGPGGALSGVGTVGAVNVNGGFLLPGSGSTTSSLNVNGALNFTSASSYVVNFDPTSSSMTKASGTAALGGANVFAVFAGGSTVQKRYTILSANAVTGTFGSLSNVNLPSNFSNSLSYDARNAYIDFNLTYAAPNGGPLNFNQSNVANALTSYFNANGGIPAVYGALTAAGLTQAAGTTPTGAQQTTFSAMDLFVGTLMSGAGSGLTGGSQDNSGEPLFYDEPTVKPTKTNALGAIQHVGGAPVAPHWSVWAEGYQGTRPTNGNAATGTNATLSQTYGVVAGADYRAGPDTVIGFGLGGGGSRFSIANSLGTGTADLYHAGFYGIQRFGDAYVNLAAGFGAQNVTTNRSVAIGAGSIYQAKFTTTTVELRGEAGRRFATPFVGVTPYVAAQVTAMRQPTYGETVVAGANTFALNYAGPVVSDPHTEFGARFDRAVQLPNASVLTLGGKLAWMHDFHPSATSTAAFQALPGASFQVIGAARSADAALVSAGAELRLPNGLSLQANVDAELSRTSNSFGGRGALRYTW